MSVKALLFDLDDTLYEYAPCNRRALQAAREILRVQEIIRGIIHERTGQDYEKIKQDTDRDYYLNAEQAKEYGLVDEVLANLSDKE